MLILIVAILAPSGVSAQAASSPPTVVALPELGLRLSYPSVLSERTKEDLVSTLRRYGRTINPDFRDPAKDSALPEQCLHLLLHVRTRAGATWMAPQDKAAPVVTAVTDELVVSEFDRSCVKSKDPEEAAFLLQYAPEFLMDAINHGYGFDPVDFTHRPQKGYPKLQGVDAVGYDLSGHHLIAGVTQVTPDQSEPPGRAKPPPLETDIRAVTALYAIFDVRGHLLVVSSMAGPFTAIPLAMRVDFGFDSGDLQPLFGFAITSLNPVTGEGIDLDPSPPK